MTAPLINTIAIGLCVQAGHDPWGPTCDIHVDGDPDAGSPWAGYRPDARKLLADEAAARVAAVRDAVSKLLRYEIDIDTLEQDASGCLMFHADVMDCFTIDPTGQAALARLLAEARAEGMREAAGIVANMHATPGLDGQQTLRFAATALEKAAILAAAEKVAAK